MKIENKADIKAKAAALLQKEESNSVIDAVAAPTEKPKKERKPKAEKQPKKLVYSFDELKAEFKPDRLFKVFNMNNQKWQWASAQKISDDGKTIHMASRGDTWDVTAERIQEGWVAIPQKAEKHITLWRYEKRQQAELLSQAKKEKKAKKEAATEEVAVTA